MYRDRRQPLAASNRFTKRFGRMGRALLTSRLTSGVTYQAGVTALGHKRATAMCLKARTALHRASAASRQYVVATCSALFGYGGARQDTHEALSPSPESLLA